MTTTGNEYLDGLADAIAARVADRLDKKNNRLMRIKEAAEYMGVSRRTLEGLISRGVIPTVREGSITRLDRQDLETWIRMRKAKV